MDQIRKPFQGVGNIIRFNWHFYILSVAFLVGLFCLDNYLSQTWQRFFFILFLLILATTLMSLLVSWYVYDLSNLYKLSWLFPNNDNIKIVNIHAGFDETSVLLSAKFPNAELIVFDFYDQEKHTEVSIKLARKVYPPFQNTKKIITSVIPMPDNCADKIFVTLAAHEIRDDNERATFFKELRRILMPEGQIFVTEHLRDGANFLAYNVGFFHFLPIVSWHQTFNTAGLRIKKQQKQTPFITIFTLEKHAATA